MITKRDLGELTLGASHVSIYDGGPESAGNMAYYRRENVFLQDGKLYIRSKKEDYMGYHYTSGKVITHKKFAIKYGRIESKIKVPYGKGFWNAFWMMPADNSWPPEIDIFEIMGKDPTTVFMTNHWKSWWYPPYRQGKTMNQGIYTGPDFSADFHIFTLEWIPNQIRWLIDGVERHKSTKGISSKSMYLIVSYNLGGDWPGYPDDTTILPQDLIVEYVKVYPY